MSTVKTNAAQIGQSLTATNNFTMYQPASPDGTVRWGVGNSGSVTDIVTLTSSGNVGIGTSSPTAALEVSRNSNSEIYSRVVNTNSGSSARTSFAVGNDASISAFGLLLNSSTNTSLAGANSMNVYLGLNASMAFYTNAIERMRIDSIGNLLVGTTTARAIITSASNSSTGFSGLDITNLSTAAVSTKFSRLAFSGTDTVGSWKPTAYINAEQVAGDINYVNSSLTFYTRFSDGIGERMRISPEGRLGIGTSGPSYKLDVSEDGTSASTVDVARFYANASATAESRILFGTLANVVSAGIGAQTSSATDGILKFYTEGSGTLAERMRIDPGGRVTLAYQPAFMAFVTTGTYTSGTFPGTLISSTVPTQRSSGYSGGTFTAPVSGLYQFNFEIYDFNATAFAIAVYRNGTIYATPGGDVYQYITVAQNMNTWSFTMYLSANDYIQMGIRGTANVSVYGGHSVWSGYLVG